MRGVRGVVGIGVLVLTLGSTQAVASAGSVPPLQPVKLQRLPLPKGFTGVSEPAWLRDGEHIVAAFTSAEDDRTQLAVMDRHGRRARCLTCGLKQVQGIDRPFNTGQSLSPKKPFVFPDGRRVLMMLVTRPNSTGGTTVPGVPAAADFNYAILECAPTLVNCKHRSLVALELPGGGLSRANQNREGRLSPDGKWFAWTQVSFEGTAMTVGRLVRGETTYTLSEPRVLTPPRPPDGNVDAATWNASAPLYELKRFTPDGKQVLFASFRSAENFDVFKLDLRTGATRRLTSEPEWDEDASQSPSRPLMAVYSSRGLDRMSPFSQFRRPTFVDFPVYASVGLYMLKQGFGTCLLAPWLLPRGGQRGTYFGQPLAVGGGGFWPAPVGQWRPQGNAIMFWESRISEAAGTPTARAVIAWLERARPRSPKPLPATPEPTWAPLRDDWQGYQSQQRTAEIPGPGGGTATVTLAGGVNFQERSVSYDGYSSDGKTFINGTERSDSPFTVLYARWQANLRASGRHTGHLNAELTLGPGQNRGSLDSVWDGHRYQGLPSASRCKSISLPKLTPRILRVRRRAGKLIISARVLARVPLDPTPRPVVGARLRLERAQARSDRAGRLRLVVSPRAAPAGAILRAHADGFRSGTVRLRG